MSKNKTRTKDKYRVVYNDTQRIELENEFRLNEYIAIPRKQEIAQKLKLSERQIKIWFQNRRAKKRKQQKRKQSAVSTTTNTTANSSPTSTSSINVSTHGSFGRLGGINSNRDSIKLELTGYSSPNEAGLVTSSSLLLPSVAPEAASRSDSQTTPPNIGPTNMVASTGSQLCTNNVPETNSWHTPNHHPCSSTKLHLQTDHLQQQHHQMNQQLFHNHSQQLHSIDNTSSYTNSAYRHPNFPNHNSTTSLTDSRYYYNYDSTAPEAAGGSDSQTTPPNIGPTNMVASTGSQLCTNSVPETNSWHTPNHHPCSSTKLHLQTDHLQQQHHQMNRQLFHNHSQQLHNSNNSNSYTNNAYRHSGFPLHNSSTSLTDNPCYFNYDPAAPGAASLTNVIHNGNSLAKQSIYH